MRPLPVALLAATLALLPVPASAAAAVSPASDSRFLTVFAAASLGEVLGDVARGNAGDSLDIALRMNVAGSQQLAAQLEQGADADLFASADEAWMNRVVALDRVAGDPVAFARNRVVVIVSRARGGRIRTLPDLGRPGVKLVLGAPAVPIGRYAREAIARLARSPGYPPDFQGRTLANVVSEEENVKGVAGKVVLGEADVGIVYATDVTPAVAARVRVIELPESARVSATCWIAVLRGPRQDAARRFVARLRSADGRRALAARGFSPVER